MTQHEPYGTSKGFRQLGHIDIPGGGQVVVQGHYAYVGERRGERACPKAMAGSLGHLTARRWTTKPAQCLTPSPVWAVLSPRSEPHG